MGKEKEFYSVGEVSRLCKISKKALRFYDELGIMSPDKVTENNYRYYSAQTLLLVPVVKYFKQMGFKLNEMKQFLEGSSYNNIAHAFSEKIEELEWEERQLNMKKSSVKDWYDLIREAEMVLDNNVEEASVKYVASQELCFLEQPYNNNYMEAIINVEFTNYIESLENEITGPVIIRFPSYEGRIAGECEKMMVLQKTLIQCSPEHLHTLGGSPMITCYHIGPHENLKKTYRKMVSWAEEHSYKLSKESYERYVTDYWTTPDKTQFVTEIMIGVARS